MQGTSTHALGQRQTNVRRETTQHQPVVQNNTVDEPILTVIAVHTEKISPFNTTMDDLVYTPPIPPEDLRPLVSKHHKQHIVSAPSHSKTSSKQVQYNIPIFTNFDGVIKAKPTHTTLTQSEVEKAGLLKAMYEESKGRRTVSDYLQNKVPSYELVEKVSTNVMVVRNKTTGENKVVIKGIDAYSVEDHVDLQRKLWLGEPTGTYADALDSAIKYNATEVIGHSRGGSTAIAVAEELGIRSTGFNSVITHQNVTNAHTAPESFRHIEFSNGEDVIVNGINAVTNPHTHGKYPDNLEFRNFAGIKGESIKGQHSISQWTADKLNRRDDIDLPFEELALKSRHAGDLITAEMFAKGVREGKTYREILNENEGGFGIIDDNGRFTSRNFRGNNMSRIFEAVGGEHTADEIIEMESKGSQQPHEHTLTENEIQGVKAGAGAPMVDHALDNLATIHERLPPVPSSNIMTIGKGIYKGVADSFKTSSMIEGVGAGIVGEATANAIDNTVGKLPGELGNLQHSTESFAVAGAFLGGIEGGAYGMVAGLAGEGARYGTDELLKKLGAGSEVRGNLDSVVAGAVSGAVMGSVAGPIGAVIGAGVGAVISETAHVAENYGDKIVNFFKNIF